MEGENWTIAPELKPPKPPRPPKLKKPDPKGDTLL
jgi:hypothetical protein